MYRARRRASTARAAASLGLARMWRIAAPFHPSIAVSVEPHFSLSDSR
jgi:hypothetical protein